MQKKDYYIGIDAGTNSIGYAVTDLEHNLLKHKGESMWGSHMFEEGENLKKRRLFRTGRRRSERRKQRINYVTEIFSPEIEKVDPLFLTRKYEMMNNECPDTPHMLFNDADFTDKDYHEKYPTIYHLINELVTSKEPHDVRLVYLACSYIVSHRGHFLNEVNKDNVDAVIDFHVVYEKFMSVVGKYAGIPWKCSENEIRDILMQKQTVTGKEKLFLELLNNGQKFRADDTERISKEGIIKLLSGGTYDLRKMFPEVGFPDKVSLSFRMKDEDFMDVLSSLGDDEAEVIAAMKNVFDWSILADALRGEKSLSLAKVKTYEQHKRDLSYLKWFIRKYVPNKYDDIFRNEKIPANYVAYSGNTKSTKDLKKFKTVKREDFCDYIRKIVGNIVVDEDDKADYDDMVLRLSIYSFLPKQVNDDNRVIPYQLNYHELKQILKNAEGYLPFLKEADENGYINEEKILSIMEFRIPYYVGPLRTDNGKFGWMKRKAEGKIFPWNFNEKVDLDASEHKFIERMTNNCSYLPGETVIPKNSILYSKYVVLNEINNIKINGNDISVEDKQGIFNLFKQQKRVTVKTITNYLIKQGSMKKEDTLSGLDNEVKSSLRSYHDFKVFLDNGLLTEDDAENIIERFTYTKDKARNRKFLRENYPQLSEEDIQQIANLKYKDFGRLSKKFLCQIEGCSKKTGEINTIIGFMYTTNENLMQLLSNRYTFLDILEQTKKAYYTEHPFGIEDMLDDMYVHNSAKRTIYRTLDILSDIRKVEKTDPKKIFIEMARGGGEKGTRTVSRLAKIQSLYKEIKKPEVKELSEELKQFTENDLQSDKIYLYFMQLGRCMYTGQRIDINTLKDKLYDIDHIYPRCVVKDDSLDNRVLVCTKANADKGDRYPINEDIQKKMRPHWDMLLKHKLISESKHQKLTRNTPFSSEEKMGFVNNQLVETRQSTKALATILKVLMPDTEIIYTKAEWVSDFRHEVLKMEKSRAVNDLHHAKDAYLNIVVGDVYQCLFTKNFYIEKNYSMKPETIFKRKVRDEDRLVWNGEESIEDVRKIMCKNSVHYTRFAFIRKGELFDQNLKKADPGLVPVKAGMDTEKYGGYGKTAGACFLYVKFKDKGKDYDSFMPVEVMYYDKVFSDKEFAKEYIKKTLENIWERKDGEITDIVLPNGMKPIKINTVLSLDGFLTCITGKQAKGKCVSIASLMPLIVSREQEQYIKRLESFDNKAAKNKKIVLSEEHDKISKKENIELYKVLSSKVINGIYNNVLRSQVPVLQDGYDKFVQLSTEDQAKVLIQIILLLKSGRAGTCDLSLIGGSKNAGSLKISAKLDRQRFEKIKIVNVSASSLFENCVEL